MRIDLHYGTQPTPDADRGKAQAASEISTLTPGWTEDQAQFSGAHVQIEALAAQASQLPEIREEKVQALRQAVESGSYRADPENIAAAMLDHMMARAAA